MTLYWSWLGSDAGDSVSASKLAKTRLRARFSFKHTQKHTQEFWLHVHAVVTGRSSQSYMFAGQWRSNDAIQKILKMPETAQRLESEGVVPAVEETPAKFEALIKAGVGIWAKVAAAAGINRIKLYARGLSFRPSYVARFPML